MATINLTNDQLDAVCGAVDCSLDWYFSAIPARIANEEEYRGLMDEFEKLCGALAILKQAKEAVLAS